MKSIKQFLSLVLLLGSMSAYAAQPNPCSNGFCDKPRLGKCKIIVTTKELLVKDCAKICGDLTVKGLINNLELDLLNNAGVPPTDEVYNEFLIPNDAVQPILENIQEFSIPRSLVVPGTEIYPDAPIYGYTIVDDEQIFTPNGGPALSYNDNFQAVNIRYHGQNPEQLAVTTKDNMESWYRRAVSFYVQRGLPLPGIDVYPQYEGQFVFNNDTSTFAIKFHYNEESFVPEALDLISVPDSNLPVSIDLFQPEDNNRLNGGYYPLRIPVTQSFEEFNQKFNKEPIVYYDNVHRRITIQVPDCFETLHEISHFELFIPQSECEVDILYTDNILAFHGTFNLMRRNALNQLVSSSFADLEYLVQASRTVTMANVFVDHEVPEVTLGEYVFSDSNGRFSGLAIPLMNGGNPFADVYTHSSDVVNASSIPTDPNILPALLEDFFELYAAGDNPATTLIEKYGSSVANKYLDSIQWLYASRGLPPAVMNGLTAPEENPNVPLPTFVAPSRLLNNVVGHEMMHNAHTLSGITQFTPTEGQATALEMDPRLNDNTYLTFRAQSWGGDYMPIVVRGNWPLTAPEINAPTTTYGSSIFWYYMATQFDYNYQVMRRMNDILTHESFGPLLEANGVPFAQTAGISGTLGYNPAGALLALDQALFDLFGKNVQDVFSDYAISLAMLRNNTSIPEEWRHRYPYWLASNTPPNNYAGFEELAFQAEDWATWWQDYQDNITLPEGYSLPELDGQSFLLTLTQDIIEYPVEDMTMLIVEIPADVTTVTVDVLEGEWRLSVLQFSSDNTPTGQFKIDGPHPSVGQTVFDISQFTGDGYVRLVAAHVSIHNYGGLNNFCQAEPIYTGAISIFRN